MTDEDNPHNPCYDKYRETIKPYAVPEIRQPHALFFSGKPGSGSELLAKCIQMAAQDGYRNFVDKKGFYHDYAVKEDVIASVIMSVYTTYYNRYKRNVNSDVYRTCEPGYQYWLFVGNETPCTVDVGVLHLCTVADCISLAAKRLPPILATLTNHALPITEEFDEHAHGEGPKKHILDVMLELLTFAENELAGVDVNTIEGFAWYSYLHDCLSTTLFDEENQEQSDNADRAEKCESMLTTLFVDWQQSVFPNFGPENLSFKTNGALQYGKSVKQFTTAGLIDSDVKNPGKKLSLLRNEVGTKITNCLRGLDND